MKPDYRVNTEETWDAIAESFDLTRQKPWYVCLEFIRSIKTTDIVADIGCGNGRHLLPCAYKCSYAIGVDISNKLLRIVQKKITNKRIINVSLIHADAVKLPLTDNSVNAVLFIASLHNIRGKQHRHHALREIVRVLKPNGVALISVWSRWQDIYWRYFIKQFFVRPREFGDIDVFWRQHNLNIPRYYHLYSRKEFQRDLLDAHFLIKNLQSVRIHSKHFSDNHFAEVQKR